MDCIPLLDDYRWLVSEQGTRWLDRVAEDRESLVTTADRLRKDLSLQRVHLVLEQTELRRRARRKFPRARSPRATADATCSSR